MNHSEDEFSSSENLDKSMNDIEKTSFISLPYNSALPTDPTDHQAIRGKEPNLLSSSDFKPPLLSAPTTTFPRSYYDAVTDETPMIVVMKDNALQFVQPFTGTLRRAGEEPLHELPENVANAIHRSIIASSHSITQASPGLFNSKKNLPKSKLGSTQSSYKQRASSCFFIPFTWMEKKVSHKLCSYIHYLRTSPQAREWKIWDICLRCVDIYYLLMIPLMLAFSCEFDESFLLHFMAFDILYILRVVFNFIRPVYNEYGELITDYKGIRTYYLKKPTGTIEVFGSIPFDWPLLFISFTRGSYYLDFTCQQPWFCDANNTCSKTNNLYTENSIRYDYHAYNIPRFLLIFSLLRINKLFSTLSTLRWLYFLKLEKFINGPVLKIIKNLLTWQLLSHVDACIFWLLETYIDSEQRFIEIHHIVKYPDGHPTPFFNRFIANLYFPFFFFFFFFSFSFRNDTRLAKERNFKIKYLSNYMIQHNFPSTLQKKIVEQEEFEWVHKRGMDTNRLFNELPKSMRLEVSVHLYYDLISKVPIFKSVEEIFKVALCERISTITVRRDFYICKAGDPGTEMYFLKSGTVEILSKDEATCIATLRTGSFFGEIALFQDCRRTATIKTIEDSQLCVLRKNDFNEILTEYPELIEVFRIAVNERQNKDNRRKQEDLEQKKHEKVENHDKLKVPESDPVRSSANLAIPVILATRKFGESVRKGFTRSSLNPPSPSGSESSSKKEGIHLSKDGNELS
ncbi:hypothetical protein HMI55_001117 [Coelomomyces lativittatus]|nr:hypothetical protein HMI55_001117 [Coelomomyces lativittatus]